MATWKKVIVSGSTANLANVQVDGLTSGSVVIGGGSGSVLTTTAINGSGNIVATTGATGLSHSGSFSGSFQGNFVGTTNLPDLTESTGITAFIYDGATTATVAVSGASTLSSNNITKWTGTAFANSSLTDNGTAITGASSIQLTGASSNLSGSFSGSLQGTATSASYVLQAVSASFATLAQTANTASYVITAQTASYVNGNIFTSTNPATSASYALSSSFASTAPAGTLTGGTLASNVLTSSLTSLGIISSLTATNAIITNNLTVQGTASFQHTTNLEVADRFVLFASGSNTTGDGGIVVQQGTQNIGELYGYDSAINRWGFTSSFSADQSSFTPAAYITTTEFAASNPSAAPLYGSSSFGFGNIHVNSSTGDIFIYS